MKFNKSHIFNLLLVAINQIKFSYSASIKVSQRELDKFDYGTDEFTLTIHGDTGLEPETKKVMQLAKFDALLHLGDYDYVCKPDSYFHDILSSSRSYKFFGVLGNHESAGQCGDSKHYRYIKNIYNEMTSSKNRNTSCKFSSKKSMWSCSYRNMRIIGLSPNISKDEKRSEQLAFLKKQLSSSKEDWIICAWHYYDGYYHTGKYPNDSNYVSGDDESFYDVCRHYGALIFSAHDHVYARTHVMTKFSRPSIDKYDYKTSSSIVQIRKGATIDILSGVGGYEIYSEGGKYKDYSHWQKKFSKGSHSENAKRFGTLNCKFNVGGNNKKAYCQFLRINSSSKVFDSFTIYRNDPSERSYSHVDDDFLNEKIAAYELKYYGKTSSSKSKVSSNDRCGSKYGNCPSGECCSKYGYCGTSSDYCSVSKGCNSKYGKCSSSSSSKKTTVRYSSSDRCGKNYGKCKNGECCSKYGWCGKSRTYCNSGCQSSFGSCW